MAKRQPPKGKQTIFLKQTKPGGIRQEFDMQHALRLLRLQAKTGRKDWVIDEKDWEFVNNEITRKPNTGNTGESKK